MTFWDYLDYSNLTFWRIIYYDFFGDTFRDIVIIFFFTKSSRLTNVLIVNLTHFHFLDGLSDSDSDWDRTTTTRRSTSWQDHVK